MQSFFTTILGTLVISKFIPLIAYCFWSFRVTNSQAQRISYKIKTTKPKLYKVTPSIGLLEVGESTNIEISTAQPLVEDQNMSDKFQVLSTLVSDQDLLENHDDLVSVWKKKQNTDISTKILRVSIQFQQLTEVHSQEQYIPAEEQYNSNYGMQSPMQEPKDLTQEKSHLNYETEISPQRDQNPSQETEIQLRAEQSPTQKSQQSPTQESQILAEEILICSQYENEESSINQYVSPEKVSSPKIPQNQEQEQIDPLKIDGTQSIEVSQYYVPTESTILPNAQLEYQIINDMLTQENNRLKQLNRTLQNQNKGQFGVKHLVIVLILSLIMGVVLGKR